MKRWLRNVIYIGAIIFLISAWFSSNDSWQNTVVSGFVVLLSFYAAWNERFRDRALSWAFAAMGLLSTTFVVDDLTGYSRLISVAIAVFAVTIINWLYRATRQASGANNAGR